MNKEEDILVISPDDYSKVRMPKELRDYHLDTVDEYGETDDKIVASDNNMQVLIKEHNNLVKVVNLLLGRTKTIVPTYARE